MKPQDVSIRIGGYYHITRLNRRLNYLCQERDSMMDELMTLHEDYDRMGAAWAKSPEGRQAQVHLGLLASAHLQLVWTIKSLQRAINSRPK